MKRLAAGLLALLTLAPLHPAPAQDGGDIRQMFGRAVAAKPQQTACPADAGLTVENGVAKASTLLDDMAGFAKLADTTGGLGRPVLTVTSTADGPPPFGMPAPAGSLRATAEQARKSGGAWIVFSPELGPSPRIDLNRTLKVPGNTTIDGGCGHVTITTTDPYTILAVGDGQSNIVVTRLYLEQRPPIVSEDGDCMTVTHDVDRVWIAHNALRKCGDGLIDIVQKAPGPAARITVAYNRFSDHDKDMGIGNCPAIAMPESHCNDVATLPWSWDKGLQVTLQDNLFAGTGGRHPRIAGLTYVHMIDTVVGYQRALRSTGKFGIAYGTYVGGGARFFPQNDLYVSLDGADKGAIFSAETPGVSAEGKDGPASMRLQDVTVLGGARADERRSDLTPAPPYALTPRLDFKTRPWEAVSCLSQMVGPDGASKAACGNGPTRP
jgi:pectate lyase